MVSPSLISDFSSCPPSISLTKALPTMSGSFCREGMQYSTIFPSDPDTHEDLRPTNKGANSDISLKDVVEQVLDFPDQPRCGFSSLEVRVPNEYNVPLSARNILENQDLKNAVKTF
ncbi:hypothetical protein MKX01_005743, partial [Papaver californicum]